MATEGIDLGQFGLASTASGLDLQLTSRAEIASPEKGFEVESCELMATERPWCRKGHDFHLSVNLHFDGDFTEASMETLSSAVSLQLGAAEIWNQLPLLPASVQHSLTGTEKASITVHLDHRDARPTKRHLHKLENGVPAHDRAPPPGVNIVTLESIHLIMRFSRAAPRKRRKLGRSVDEVSAYPANSESHYERNSGACRRSKTSPVPESATCDHADMLFEAGRSTPEKSEVDDTIIRTSRKRSYSTGDLKVGGETPGVHEDLLELFNAGLRLAVTPHPSRLPKGVRILSNESFKHLAESFPALWSPGHLAAVSSRAVFLPTVSHAIATVCSLHARNPVLRSKLAELDRQVIWSSRGLGISSTSVEQGSPLSAQQSVATRLWETAQRALFDKDGTCSMRPFSQYFESGLNEQDENIWADPVVLGNGSVEDQDIDDFLSDSDDSMLDEQPLIPEARAGHGTSLLWNDSDPSDNHIPEYSRPHVAGRKRGFHVEQVQENDEVLSICDSVGSIVIDGFMDVASSPGPEAWLVPSEDVEEQDLLDARIETDVSIHV